MIGRVHGSWRRIAGAGAAAAVLMAVASCSTGDAVDRNRRASDVYVAVLDTVLDTEPEPETSAGERGGDTGSTTSTSTPTSGSGGSATTSSTSSTSTSSTTPSASTSTSSTTSAAARGGGDDNDDKDDRKTGKSELPLLFVSPLEEGRPFPLEVQAAVIERLERRAVVRFVDTQQQAVDAKLVDHPVLDGGILLRLGRVPAEGAEVPIAAERYQRTGDWSAMRFVVRAAEGGWTAALIDRQPRPAGS